MIRLGVSAFLTLFPWPLRRRVLARAFGYRLHPTSRIGLSWICPRELVMGPHARIGHLTICRGFDRLEMGEHARLGNANWVTGRYADDDTFFAGGRPRTSELLIGSHSAVTSRHFIDCTNSVHIGHHVTVGGYRSQILTHSIDIRHSRQDSSPITIGDYSFIGTQCVILGGSALPPRSVLGALSLLNTVHTEPFTLYAGVPARPVKDLGPDHAYFDRAEGFVH